MKLEAGRMLAHYRLIEPLGQGGMGQVWKAMDTTLQREVAIKLLPEAFLQDADRLGRFEREAKVLATLNHPGIAQIYGFHRQAEVCFLAMERVAGEDLSQRLARGPMSLEEALQVASQVADAVEEAHEHGIIHRDLKPANIIVQPDGTAKVLDFGLAKVQGGAGTSSASDLSLSPTVTSLGTQAGVILGTAAYMSPEQARGKHSDRRTDIWSLGCVLVEMLTGRRPFSGETLSDTIALILQSQPDWSTLPPRTPPGVRELLQRCLQRDPRKRLRDMGDARLELEQALEERRWERPASDPATAARRPAWMLPAALVIGAVVGAAGWAMLRGGSAPPDGRSLRVSVETPPGIVPESAYLAPDGSAIVFRGAVQDPDPATPAPSRLFLRRLDAAEAQPLPGTEEGVILSISPDARWLAYAAPIKPGSPQVRIYKMPLDGKAPSLALADRDRKWSQGGLWMPDDRLLFSGREPLSLTWIATDGSGVQESMQIAAEGSGPEMVLADVLPGGQVLATSYIWDQQGYHEMVFAVDTANGAAKKILENGSSPRWSPTGHVLFSREDALLALSFDPKGFAPRGGPIPLADDLRTAPGAPGAEFDLSEDGTLLYQTGGRVGSRRRLVTFTSDEDLQPWSEDRLSFAGSLEVSPDGEHLSATVMTPGDLLFTVWVSELDRPALRLWMSMPQLDCQEARWVDPGWLLVNCEGNTDEAGVYLAPLDRSSPPRLVWKGGYNFADLQSVRPQADRFLVQLRKPEGLVTLLVPLDRSGDPSDGQPLFPADRDVWGATFSPDGSHVSYLTADSGRTEIRLAPLRSDGTLGTPRLVATTPSQWAAWEATGTEGVYDLVFARSPGRWEAARVRTSPLSIGTPEAYLDALRFQPRLNDIERLPDGTFLAIQRDGQDAGNRRLDLVLNFSGELQRLER